MADRGSSSNMGVDYVISYRYGNTKDKSSAESQFEKLLTALERVGLRTEVRDGADGNLLVFLRIRSTQKLVGEAYRARVKDWLFGVRPAAPDRETQRSLDAEPVTAAERLRIVHALITLPESEGGAGITPRKRQWSLVEGIFPLHDPEFNKAWVTRWSTTWTVKAEELEKIRNMFGEKVAFYFAFLRTYFSFLVLAACIGAGTYFFLPAYSSVYAIANCLWSVIFVEYWKHEEVELAVRWNVRNVSQLETKRAEFQPTRYVEDPVTSERVGEFPAWKRLSRQALQIPFALGASVILSALYAVVFTIEIFIAEVYNGPFKNFLVFLPTVLLTILVPVFTHILTNLATKLTDYENYRDDSAFERAQIQKQFVFNFITSYVPLMLTAFVYVPFGNLIVPHLDVLNLTADPSPDAKGQPFQVNPHRLRSQFIYVAVTQQAVNLAMESIVPYFTRKALNKAKEIQTKRNGETYYANDDPEEQEFLQRVRWEADLDPYDVNTDLREMCMQFGCLTLFGPTWPLAAVSFVLFDFIQLRSDSAKICIETRRPVPHRADSIGPWLDNLGFLTWMGSISSAALVYLFSSPASEPNKTPTALSIAGFLTALFLSEHVYFTTALIVRKVLSKLPESPALQMERRERFMVRRRYLQESLGVDEESEPKDIEQFGLKDGSHVTGFWDKHKNVLEAGLDVIRDSKKGQ